MVVLPPPFNEICFALDIVTVVFQMQLPPGTSTMSSVAAELIAFCTSICEHDAAVIVLASAPKLKNALKSRVTNAVLTMFAMGPFLLKEQCSQESQRVCGS